MHVEELPTPTLLLDLDRLEANIARMAAKAEQLEVSLRPHVKTHKSIEVGRLQLEAGAVGITVSTLYEARCFAEQGFESITWAFPVILNRLPEVLNLARRIQLAVVIDSTEALTALESTHEALSVFLKIDCGYHRAGVAPTSELALQLASRLEDSATLSLNGLLTHAGHSYSCVKAADIRSIAHQERDVMLELAERLRDSGVRVPVVSIGSTPTMSVVESLEGIDEIRPGNYVFYDLSQVAYGSCAVSDCALTVLTSVVSGQPGGNHSVIDAGALALSKDAGPTERGHQSYGAIYRDHAGGVLDDSIRVTGLSQEHGIVDARLDLGRQLRILPNHSCLTAAQFDEYVVVRDDRVVDRWPVRRGR